MILAILFLIAGFLAIGKPVYAVSPPVQLSPVNNSTVSSSKLTWEAPQYTLYPTNPYRIQVDDNSNFSSIFRDYTTKNTYYTPVLNEGTWHWRIKAKDSGGTWSEWSNAWSFILGSSTPSPSPTPTPTSTPTSIPTPSPTPTATAAPVSITISNVPSQIDSGQSFNVSVSLSSNNPSIYFKGAFKKPDSSNYFGLTKVSGSWVKNSSTYSNQYQGSGSFDLEIKPDVDDSGYTGSGDYLFKVAGYATDGNLSWSNETTINIQSVNTEALTTPEPEPSPTPQTAPTPQKPLPSISKISTPKQYKIASIAGTATRAASVSSTTKIITDQQFNPLKIIGAILILTGLSIPIFFFIKLKIKSKAS